jgi:cell division protein ZapA
MAQVTLRINGYAYTVGCKDGEEEHLQAMAGEVDRRIETVKAVAGQSGEARMLVMASLLMADDLFEMSRGRQGAPLMPAPADPRLGQRLDKLAQRAEEIALDLERP